ncbi:hypothetical protein ACFRFL_14065 [Streptomyces sp. NPDC056708]|uniref:hypothetical protein n=1 Tax=unclassified Streptomyces TaxID=2593676 RepID=UPI00368CC4D1
MFRETIVHPGGTTEGTASEAHVRTLLRRAARRKYRVQPTIDGGAWIHWTTHTYTGPQSRSITLRPHPPVGAALDRHMVHDLTLAGDGTASYAEQDGRRLIVGHAWEIPPMATARLRARSLVTDTDGLVRLTLTAQLALHAHHHRTQTARPGGKGGPGGLVHSRLHSVLCECGYQQYVTSDAEAQRKALEHREAAATDFVNSLSPAPTRKAIADRSDTHPFPDVTLREHSQPGSDPTFTVFLTGWFYGRYKTRPGAMRAAERASNSVTAPAQS